MPESSLSPEVPEFGKSNLADVGHRQSCVREVDGPKKPAVTDHSADHINATTALEQTANRTPRAKETPGYLANRRIGLFVIPQDNPINRFPSSLPRSLARCNSMTLPSLPMKHISTNVRLSLSLDGKARVVTGPDNPPSPPRVWSPQESNILEKRPGGGLQRSHSAFEPYELPSVVPRRSMVGRSRDARVWEFYCDSEASNTLTEQAELEKSGSAVGTIGLIRSGSNKAMRPNSNKRNAHTQKSDCTKKQKPDDHFAVKPKLGRAVSSVARLQTIDGNQQRTAARTSSSDPKRKLPSSIFEDEGADSDKENWEPGTQRRPVQRRRAVNSPGVQRGVLKENSMIPSQSSSLESLLNREDSSPRSSRPR